MLSRIFRLFSSQEIGKLLSIILSVYPIGMIAIITSTVVTYHQVKLKLILSSNNVYAKFAYVSDHLKNAQIKQHDSIIQAIHDHDPEAAEKAMEAHLDQIMDDVRQYYQETE